MRSVSCTYENNEAKEAVKKVLYLRETGCQWPDWICIFN